MARFPFPPGPRNILPGQQILFFRRTPQNFLRLARKYGDFVHFKVGPERFYLANDPDVIREVLVTRAGEFVKGWGPQRGHTLLGDGLLTTEGERHRRQRRLVQPAFHNAKVDACAGTMVRLAVECSNGLPEGRPVDMWREMMRLTLAITNETLFGASVSADADRIMEATAIVFGQFGAWMFPYARTLWRLWWPLRWRYNRALRDLNAVFDRIIADRRRSNSGQSDLLSMLIEACGNESKEPAMTEQNLRDEVAAFFMAGHETLGNALSWTWHLVAQHPEVGDKLHAEAVEELGGRLPVAADFPRLRYAEQVLAESLRMYPPLWMMGRRALKDCRIGGWMVPGGSVILVSPYVTQRDPRHFPLPGRFDPERWRPEMRTTRPQFSYFPFGGGPRGCVGEGFAWMEGVLLIAILALRWRFCPVPGAVVRELPLFMLRPKDGVRLILQRR